MFSGHLVMKGFSILSIMLPLLMISNVFSPVAPVSPVKVNLHDVAILPCSQTCSGLVTWTVFHKPHDILAQCNQTSCQSQEGFHMSHDQYLKGDLSLTITDVDHTNRAWYICKCDGVEISDVHVQIEPVNVHKHVEPGKSLSMDVPVLEPVEVILNRTGDTTPITVRLCEIRGCEIQCLSEYEKRVTFNFSLQLKEMKESDIGVYTLWYTRNDVVIGTYTVAGGVPPQEIRNPTSRVNVNNNATLSCNRICSGLVTWTVYRKPHILAQCNQTLCQSKEGFHMSHDQYLKGDLSLTITDVDYNKMAWYTCECDGTLLCDWNLEVNASNKKVHVLPGESLTLAVPVSEPVEVVFNKTDHDRAITVRLCEIRGCEIQCVSEYEKRVLFRSSLQLKEMKESDSGVYTIRDTKNDEVISTYTVTVGGRQDGPGRTAVEKEPDNLVLAVVLPVSIILVVVVVVVVVVVKKKKMVVGVLGKNSQCCGAQPTEHGQEEQRTSQNGSGTEAEMSPLNGQSAL
ncbi:uncharacterized protein LOC143509681 [Brachyhypopomus gauderio]|uniref:uncharacterized protein LOC143509681 n=1 Tax=Brachyhypopomus gauderio TaxID=698409 RepID=UPI004041F96D